ncbi:MAG: hypothetical protein WBV61_09130 [Rhodanobacteraceae bacterium]
MSALRTILIVLALGSVAWVGYRSGSVNSSHLAPTANAAAMPRALAMEKPKRPQSTNHRAPVTAPAVRLPADVSTLDGQAFLAALPTLERRARSGDASASDVLFFRFNGCVNYDAQAKDDKTKDVEDNYQRDVKSEQNIRKEHPGWERPTGISSPAEYRADRLRQIQDQFDVCKALTPAQIEQRLDWARVSLEQHDRSMILDLARSELQIDDAELLRNTDRLLELREMERIELDRLIETGDTDAIQAAAYASTGQRTSLVRPDLQRALMLALTLRLASPAPDSLRGMIDRLEQSSLTNAQIQQAESDARALYRRCCAKSGA